MTGSPPALACRRLDVAYDGSPVVSGLDLEVAADEVVALLGPSGSGKTTLLSAVAGFLPAAGGEIELAGRVVGRPGHHVPAERRDVGVVFQAAALWPHMTALETVAYPLRRRGMGPAAARREASALLERLGIGHLADRRPAQLSGGEQQRVGLGRALARAARLHLFDEPTAHLDPELRTRLQSEIAAQRRKSGTAALYATHDTTEALAVADRVALLRGGRLVQVGSPRDVYEQPVDAWAARLTGPASIVALRVLALDAGRGRVELCDSIVDLAAAGARAGRDAGEACGLVRPDWARLGGDLPGRVGSVAYRGTHTDYALETPAGPVVIREPGPPRAGVGQATCWRLDRIWLLDPATGG